MLHSDSNPPLGFHKLHNIDLREIFEYVHLKFMVSGRSKQASKQPYTHVHNAVTLVWGSLKLTPNISTPKRGTVQLL